MLFASEGHQGQPVHGEAQQQPGQRRPPTPVGQELLRLKPAPPAQQQPTEAPPHHAGDGSRAEAAEILPEVAGPAVGDALQAAATGLVDAMEGGKASHPPQDARNPAGDQISVSVALDDRSPQQWKAEQAKTAGGGGQLEVVVSPPPDPLTDQRCQAGHQGFRADAAAAHLGQSSAEDGAAVVAWRSMAWIPQFGDRLGQFRQQCLVTGAMELAEQQPDAAAHRQRPDQRNLPVQPFHQRIAPERSGDHADQSQYESSACATDGSSQ